MKSIPEKTQLGKLSGRDCIYVDTVAYENRTNNLVVVGELNGSLCEIQKKDCWIPFKLIFEDVLVSKITELDTWMSQRNVCNESCFDCIQNSEWLRGLGGKKTSEHQHFVLLTYDDVFEVISKSYVLHLQKPCA